MYCTYTTLYMMKRLRNILENCETPVHVPIHKYSGLHTYMYMYRVILPFFNNEILKGDKPEV